MSEYWYAHETARFDYTVSVSPPPADQSKAVLHRGGPGGPVLSEQKLVACGSSSLAIPLSKLDVRKDSPVFVTFSFEKDHPKVAQKKQAVTHVLSLAESEPAEIHAPPAYPGEEVELKITEWAAVAYDKPGGKPTLFRESNAQRVSPDAKKQVSWRVDGKDLATKGPSVKYKPTDDQVGQKLAVEAFIHSAENGAKGELKVITVSKVTPDADLKVYVNQDPDETKNHGRFVTVKATVDVERAGVPVFFEIWASGSNRTGLAAKEQASLLATKDTSAGAPVQAKLKVKTDAKGVATAHLRVSTFGGDYLGVTATTAESHHHRDDEVLHTKKIQVWQKLFFDAVEMKRPGGGVFEWKGAVQTEFQAAFADAFVEFVDTGVRHQGDYVFNFGSAEDGFKWADKYTDKVGAPQKVHFCLIDCAIMTSGTYGPSDKVAQEDADSASFTSANTIHPFDLDGGYFGFFKTSWLKKAEYQKPDGTWAKLDAAKVTLDDTRGWRHWKADLSDTGLTPTAAAKVPVRITYRDCISAGGWGGENALHLLICRGSYEDGAKKGVFSNIEDQITTACIHEPGHALGLVPKTSPTHDASHSSHCTSNTCTMWWQSLAANHRFHAETAAQPNACRATVKGGDFDKSKMSAWKFPR